jgi:holo-[acyl-carrier protein] synthase
VIYTGVDIVEVARIARAVERWGARFLRRVFTDGELAHCGAGEALRLPSLAARWAAKEAAAKLLGVGVRGLGAGARGARALAWHELEVAADANGRPRLLLHGAARARADAVGIAAIDLSLSHTADYAVASVVALALPQQG